MTEKLKRYIYTILSIILILIIIYALLRYRNSIWTTILSIDLRWFFLGIFLYFLNYCFRGWRLLTFTKKITKSPFIVFLKVSGTHGFYNYFMPLRSGDFTLPFLLHLYCGLPVRTGVRVLVKARLLDIISLGIIISSVSILHPFNFSERYRLYLLLCGLTLLIAPIFIIFISRNKSAYSPEFIRNIIPKNSPSYPAFFDLFITMTIWICTGTMLYCVVKSIGIPMQYIDVWLLIAIQLPLQLLPFQGLANTGNHELGWLSALALLGINFEQSVSYALSSHILLICYVLLLGGLTLTIPALKSSPRQH
ncbi:MAG: flippase-like domain-containing protein [Desulfobulbaceae bacterium]|nr:flippase-like domain-containing protein [Desulfobulbaceae bacterium]